MYPGDRLGCLTATALIFATKRLRGYSAMPQVFNPVLRTKLDISLVVG